MDRLFVTLGHIIPIPSQPVFAFLLYAACLAEKQQIPIYCLLFDLIGLEPTIYHTQGEHANHYTTDAVYYIEYLLDKMKIKYILHKELLYLLC